MVLRWVWFADEASLRCGRDKACFLPLMHLFNTVNHCRKLANVIRCITFNFP